MKVIKIRHLEDCSDGSLVKSLLFDQVVTREFIHFLGRAGELTYIASFARPFYQVTIPNDGYLKGVEGLKAARLKLTHPDTVDETLAFLENLVQQYQDNILNGGIIYDE